MVTSRQSVTFEPKIVAKRRKRPSAQLHYAAPSLIELADAYLAVGRTDAARAASAHALSLMDEMADRVTNLLFSCECGDTRGPA
jgi:hypothetical protein